MLPCLGTFNLNIVKLSTFELVHVLKECTIVAAVVLYLECVESLSEATYRNTVSQCKASQKGVRFQGATLPLKGCVNSGSNTAVACPCLNISVY